MFTYYLQFIAYLSVLMLKTLDINDSGFRKVTESYCRIYKMITNSEINVLGTLYTAFL